MKPEETYDGYGSYEAYINRGLEGIFHTDKVENSNAGGSSGDNKQAVTPTTKRTRIKAKDVHDIVVSYPHHRDDSQWIADILLRLPLAKREPVMLRYGQVYNSAQSAVADNEGQAGQARRDANTWLLEYVER